MKKLFYLLLLFCFFIFSCSTAGKTRQGKPPKRGQIPCPLKDC